MFRVTLYDHRGRISGVSERLDFVTAIATRNFFRDAGNYTARIREETATLRQWHRNPSIGFRVEVEEETCEGK